jgi:hypothetical protein
MAPIVADLLEALLQIKALAGTPERVARLLVSSDARRWTVRRTPGERAPAEILAHLGDAEAVFCLSARLVLTGERPPLPVLGKRALGEPVLDLEWDPEVALNRFRTRRAETVELLSSCSAAQLERAGVHPVRKLVSLADLVAIMLAHDTDHIGEILEQVGPDHVPMGSPGDP